MQTTRKLNIGVQVLMTPGVQAEVPTAELMKAMARHQQCDYGHVHADDAKANDLAINSKEGRVLSSYMTADGTVFWIITDGLGMPEHLHTVAMLPSEY